MKQRLLFDAEIRGWLHELAENRADMGVVQQFAEGLLATRRALRGLLSKYCADGDSCIIGRDARDYARRCLPEYQKEKKP
jgi:hypothetical protein